MSRNELERLLADLRSNTGLGEGFDRLQGDVEAQVRWAIDRGYSIAREEVDGLVGSVELSDDELDEAAGGWSGDPASDPGAATPPPDPNPGGTSTP